MSRITKTIDLILKWPTNVIPFPYKTDNSNRNPYKYGRAFIKNTITNEVIKVLGAKKFRDDLNMEVIESLDTKEDFYLGSKYELIYFEELDC